MKSVFPYQILSRDVRLTVDGLRIDNVPAPLDAYVSDAQQVVALQALTESNENWREVRLMVSVTADAEELANGPWHDIVCVAVVTNRRANVYTVFPLSSDGTGRWTGDVELPRGEHVGRSELTVRVVASVDGVPGRLIGAAPDPWYIAFQAKQPVADRVIPMRWVEFSKQEGFEQYVDDPWLLDFDAGDPFLHLNSEFDGLREALQRSGSAEQRLFGEVLGSQIATEVWASLFGSALYATELDAGQVVWPEGWLGDVLRELLPDMYPDVEVEEKLAELVAERVAGGSGADLQRRLHHAAGRRALRTRKLSAGLRDLRKLSTKKEIR
ncbi:hypothetical protein K7B10_25180 [Streptomyces flavotricini]|uniref:Uncharacterized protein n=1 Tax=Streptomyces flavotricini TaxID=66888 RepID=A0ABS8ECP8_9ACTN|nr:hypothetical protein [Streptomyces flavotricini]MCC0098009.1 hypothetical protein [Streptomyces flavotricini]